MMYYKQLADSKGEQKGAHKNIVLTGAPEMGKTTIVKKLVDLLNSRKDEIAYTGFLTTEIRTGVVRQGFQIIPVGEAAQRVQPWVLGHMDLSGGAAPMVSKYGVDVETFNKNIPECLKFKSEDKLKVAVIDEISMMECYSEVFQTEVKKLFDSDDVIVIASVGQRGHDFMDQIRHRQDIHLRVLTSPSDAISDDIPKDLWENVCKFLGEEGEEGEIEDDDEIPEEEITGKLEDTSISEKSETSTSSQRGTPATTQGSGSTQQAQVQGSQQDTSSTGGQRSGTTQQGTTQQGTTQQGTQGGAQQGGAL